MRSKDKDLLQRIKEYVENYCDRHGYGPSTREVALEMGIGNGTASRYLRELENQGELSRGKVGYESNSYTMTNRGMNSLPIFINGVPCGPLTEIEGIVEGYVKLPETFTGKGKFFMLRASGYSMIDADIHDGDYVLVRQQSTAEVGDIIVALVDNMVTLKRLMFDVNEQQYYLHPENSEMEDIYVDDIAVQGVAVKVIKDLF